MSKLAQQIAETEQRAQTNRTLARTRYNELKTSASAKLAQPKTLLGLFAGGALIGFLTARGASPARAATPGGARRAARFDQITQLISTLTRASVILTPLLKWFQSRKTTVTKTTEPPADSPAEAPRVEQTVIKES